MEVGVVGGIWCWSKDGKGRKIERFGEGSVGSGGKVVTLARKSGLSE